MVVDTTGVSVCDAIVVYENVVPALFCAVQKLRCPTMRRTTKFRQNESTRETSFFCTSYSLSGLKLSAGISRHMLDEFVQDRIKSAAQELSYSDDIGTP